MIDRRDTLAQALADISTGSLGRAATVVVSQAWWGRLSTREQDAYRVRAEEAGVRIAADEAMSGHYVEIRDDAGPPLSSERPT
jgi:hypothetical protein